MLRRNIYKPDNTQLLRFKTMIISMSFCKAQPSLRGLIRRGNPDRYTGLLRYARNDDVFTISSLFRSSLFNDFLNNSLLDNHSFPLRVGYKADS